MTGYETFKHSNHLSTYCLYCKRDKASAHRDGKNCAIPACHRDKFTAQKLDKKPDGFAGNTNSLNCRAVSVHNRGGSNNIIDSLLSLFGGSARP